MTASVLSRRELLKLSAALAAAAALASCAPKATEVPKATEAPKVEATPVPPTAAPAKLVALDYWFCWSGRYSDIQRNAVLSVFEKEYEGKIKINDLPVPSNIDQKLLTAVAANESPDVANCFGALIPLGAKGAFLIINEYVNASKTLELDQIYPFALKACIWKGNQYGFPYNCSAEMMLFNVDLFQKAGLDATKGPETWDEFTEMSKKLVEVDSAGALKTAAYTNWMTRHNAAWFWINGGEAYNVDTGALTINDPKNVEGLQTVINYAWNVYGDIAKADEFVAGAGSAAEGPFCTGGQSVVYAGDWDPATYYEWCPTIKVYPAQFPHGPQGKSKVAIGAGDYIGILKGSKNPKEAYTFAEWMVMKGNLLWTKAGVDTNCIMRDAGVVRTEWPKIFGDKAAEIAKWWAQSASLAHPVQNFPAYSFMNDELGRVFDLAFHKKATAQEALDEAQKNVDEEIKKTS